MEKREKDDEEDQEKEIEKEKEKEKENMASIPWLILSAIFAGPPTLPRPTFLNSWTTHPLLRFNNV